MKISAPSRKRSPGLSITHNAGAAGIRGFGVGRHVDTVKCKGGASFTAATERAPACPGLPGRRDENLALGGGRPAAGTQGKVVIAGKSRRDGRNCAGRESRAFWRSP